MLSEHLCRVFETMEWLEMAAVPCVGLHEARPLLASYEPDVVIADYDLLIAGADEWNDDPATAGVPLIAVSLTRRMNDAMRAKLRWVEGFLYLPAFDHDAARRLFLKLRRDHDAVSPPNPLAWPGTTLGARRR